MIDPEPPSMVIKAGVSEDELYAMSGEDSGWEYVGGRLVVEPASNRHQDLFRFLLILLGGSWTSGVAPSSAALATPGGSTRIGLRNRISWWYATRTGNA